MRIFKLVLVTAMIFTLWGCLDVGRANADVVPEKSSANLGQKVGDPLVQKSAKAEPLKTATLKLGGQPITVGEPLSHANLTVFPLLATSGGANPFVPLDVAMDAKKLSVTETGSGGTVPTLRVRNTSKEMIFVMTGEIVTGAKQDRMSAHDVILPPESKDVMLPVYCVEQGRWRQQSRQFAAGKTAGTTTLRKSAARKASQGTIWAKVAKKSGDAAVHSATGTMQAVYNSQDVKKEISAFEQTLWLLAAEQKQMVGFVAAVGNHIASADLFANHDLFLALWPKLLKAVAIDAVTSKTKEAAPSRDQVVAFLQTGENGARRQIANPGLGVELLIDAQNDISGTALLLKQGLVHLSLFGPDREANVRTFGSRSVQPVQQRSVLRPNVRRPRAKNRR